MCTRRLSQIVGFLAVLSLQILTFQKILYVTIESIVSIVLILFSSPSIHFLKTCELVAEIFVSLHIYAHSRSNFCSFIIQQSKSTMILHNKWTPNINSLQITQLMLPIRVPLIIPLKYLAFHCFALLCNIFLASY